MSVCSVSSTRGRWILVVTTLTAGMGFLVGSAVSIALPAIQIKLGATLTDLQWILNSYILMLAAFMLIGGSLGDKFGRKKIFTLGIIIFIIGSGLSGFSQDVLQLVFSRVVQGLGAAMMVPACLALINSCFVLSERGKAIGIWAGFSGGIAALGPLIGGWLVESFGWQSIFFIYLPLGLIAFAIAVFYVPRDKLAAHTKLDWRGAVLITLSLLSLSFALIQSPVRGWRHGVILASFAVALITAFLFIINEKRAENPIMPLVIFKKPIVSGANIITFLLYTAFNGVLFFLVLNFQQVQGLSPIKAGLAMLPPVALITLFSGKAGALADRIGPRIPMLIGSFLATLGLALLVVPGTQASYVMHFLPALTLFGAGMVILIPPLTKSALSVEEKWSGAASGVNNAVARIAALVAVSLLGAILLSVFSTQLKASISSSGLTLIQQKEILQQSEKLGAINIPDYFPIEAAVTAREAIQKAFVDGFRWIMAISASLALLSTLLVLALIKKKQIVEAEPLLSIKHRSSIRHA